MELLKYESTKKKDVSVEIKNNLDDICSVDAQMKLEQGPLIENMLKNRSIHCMAFCASNTDKNDVAGVCNGSTNYVALSIKNDLLVYNIISGNLENVFVGSLNKGYHAGVFLGHTSMISSIFFYDARIYTGAMDKM